MKRLNLYPITEVDNLAWPEEMAGLTMASPALRFFTDFTKVKPLVIDSTLSAVEVKRLMQQTHVRLKFVLNDAGQFIGIVSLDDLIDRKIVQKVSEGNRRDDIALTELMTPKTDLKALDYQEVSKASILEVVRTLKDSGEQHCLVVDLNDHKIRGIFSASDISRKLHLPIDIQDKSSFYKVFSTTA